MGINVVRVKSDTDQLEVPSRNIKTFPMKVSKQICRGLLASGLFTLSRPNRIVLMEPFFWFSLSYFALAFLFSFRKSPSPLDLTSPPLVLCVQADWLLCGFSVLLVYKCHSRTSVLFLFVFPLFALRVFLNLISLVWWFENCRKTPRSPSHSILETQYIYMYMYSIHTSTSHFGMKFYQLEFMYKFFPKIEKDGKKRKNDRPFPSKNFVLN